MQIELTGACYEYQQGAALATPVIKDLDLKIEKGELLALIGPSGAGKSTLAMLISGLYLPQRGKVLAEGKEATKKSHFRNVGMVFQYPEQQFFSETVYEEIAFGPLNYGVKNENIEPIVVETLSEVGLDAAVFMKRSPFSLSGGEKRRVAIAAVLALDTEILIFDEPTAGLDADGRRFVIELARKQHDKGKTVIWISHNMDEVAALSERVVVLKEGSLIMDGSAAEVFSRRDRLKAAGLDLPRASLLLGALKEKDFDLPAKALTIEGAVKEILAAGGKAGC